MVDCKDIYQVLFHQVELYRNAKRMTEEEWINESLMRSSALYFLRDQDVLKAASELQQMLIARNRDAQQDVIKMKLKK